MKAACLSRMMNDNSSLARSVNALIEKLVAWGFSPAQFTPFQEAPINLGKVLPSSDTIKVTLFHRTLGWHVDFPLLSIFHCIHYKTNKNFGGIKKTILITSCDEG